MEEKKKNIYETINEAMKEIDYIGKDKKCTSGASFAYRGIDQVLNTLKPVFEKVGLFSVPNVLDMTREERTTKTGGVITYTILTIEYTFYALDGSFVKTVVKGEAMDSGDKSCNKAMSVAYKYACFQLLSIPTEETAQDPDETAEELMPKKVVIKKEYKCEKCGKAFKDVVSQKDGKKYTAGQIYEMNKKKNGMALCSKCVGETNA